MNDNLKIINEEVYSKCGLNIFGLETEDESKEYAACRFEINGLRIISRNAKITPRKIGQFVTFWKRNDSGIIEPLNEFDRIDFYVITVKNRNKTGQFVFPKSILIKKGILTTSKKEGKRGFRVYPAWDKTENNQSKRTQKWQLNYFYEITSKMDLDRVVELFKMN